MTLRWAHITDLHLADRDFGNHVQGVQDELWVMLAEVAELCVVEERELFVTGDLFEHKQPRQISHRLVLRLITYFQELKDRGVTTYMIAGNHDLTSDGMASLDRQPLGVIAASGAVTLLQESIIVDDVQITPLNFEDRAEYDPEFYRVARVPGFPHVVLAHGMIAPAGKNYPYTFIPQTDVPNEGDFDLMLYGHPHDDHGIRKVNGATYVSCGSFCRRSRAQKRGVRIAVGEVTSGPVVRCRARELLTARPWQDLFLEETETYEIVANPEMAALAQDARKMLQFDEIDFRELLTGMRPKLKNGVYDSAYNYLTSAEVSLYGG